MDLKILQIDADLRKPQIHLRLGLNNITGLSNLITDKDVKISDVIQAVPDFKNWDIITSGAKPPEPIRLLNSKSMEKIINDLREENKYDLIIIDCPPVTGLADSLLISEKCDGSILLISNNLVQKDLAKQSIDRILESGANFLGTISNSTVKSSDNFLNKYSYYNYSYTYNDYIDKELDTNNRINKSTKIDKIKDVLLNQSNEFIKNFFKWLDN